MLLPIFWIALTVVILSTILTLLVIGSVFGIRYVYSRREDYYVWLEKYWSQAFYKVRYLIKK